MYEYTCAYCGKVVQVRWLSQAQKFCSKSCAASYGNTLRAGRSGSRNNEDVDECIFQPETIMCGKRKCESCGWNPVVAKARLEAITGKMNQTFEEPKPEIQECKWISVDERLPKDREQVLAFTHLGKVMSLHCEEGIWKARDNIKITHWMPMPLKPEE